MLAAMGLRDLGVRWGNLTLPRERWMPSVLAEGAFMMFPRHEAALRTGAFQDAYARGVEAGLRAFLRDLAAESAPPAALTPDGTGHTRVGESGGAEPATGVRGGR